MKLPYSTKADIPGEIILQDPATPQTTAIVREEPDMPRRTLGAWICPSGASQHQMTLAHDKTETMLTKITCSSLLYISQWCKDAIKTCDHVYQCMYP